ncbi:MAG: hypothetical protein J7L79_05610 [Thaumarchaeota archaeon]|nr:hypothetical protein [Nitrososphaerota archaeon]
MRVKLTLALTDRPGVLLKALEQIAVNGGNIISIIHRRDRITSGYVPVSINIEFPDSSSLERAKKSIEASGIPVIEAETLEKVISTVILVGRVSIEDLTEKLQELGSRVAEISMIGGLTSPCLKLVLEAPSGKLRSILNALEKLAERRNVLLITEG